MASYPQMFRVRQKFETPHVEDVPGEVRAQLERLELAGKVKPGQSVAITAGSRGITNI
ncbi:MAG: [Fe-S]-binding protein, partial [Planctomycetes bacterium]|nr:[Fe-S]-binding protein [Planctomycetota bacterium]